ncbi:MAG: peptidyl-prolyl cis-trans isomerase [Fimbriimonadales bacterium]
MRIIVWSAVGVVTLSSALVLSGCGGAKNEVVAKIGETTIDKDTYLRRLETLPTPVQIAGNQAVTSPAGYTMLVQMVREQILLDMAKEQGVLPTDQQVEERVQRELKNNPQVKQYITDQKILTLDDYRRQVRLQLAEFNLRTKGITVTEQEIKQAYENSKQAFYQAAKARARFIQINNPEVRKQIDDDLKRGFNFQSVVQKYAQNPVAGVQSGEAEFPLEGALNTNNPQGRQALARIRNVLRNTKPLETTGWIQLAPNEFARFELLSRSPGRQLPYDEVKEQIREQLMIFKGQANTQALALEMAKRMVNTPVTFTSERWKLMYEKEMEQIKQMVEQAEKRQGQPQQTKAPAGQPTASR